MKNNKKRIFALLLAVMLCMTVFSTVAYAGGGPETEEPEPTPTPEISPVPLTPDGNLTLVDDIEGQQSEDKQFITVVTKNGNYFYIIIDRASDSDNVYFLNMVDEADLLALIEDKDSVPPAPVITPQQPEPDPEPTTEPQPEKGGGMGGVLALVLIIAALGGGAFYYFKVLKPKQAVQGGTDLDELDFEDEDETAGLIRTNPEADGQEDEE